MVSEVSHEFSQGNYYSLFQWPSEKNKSITLIIIMVHTFDIHVSLIFEERLSH